MNYFDLMKAITQAHVEAQGLPTAEDSSSALCIDAGIGKAGVNHPSSSPLKVHDGGTD